MKIKVMSFNLRYDNEGDGINSFSNRFSRVVEVIGKECPDLIGFQEITESMYERLKKSLCDYTVLYCGRNKDYFGESTAIAFRSGFSLISYENLWLSYTPCLAGSHFGGGHSPCPRLMSSALLKHKEAKEPFLFVCTHLDHVAEREKEADFICEYLNNHEENFVLVGDFNAEPDAPEIKLILDTLSKKGVVDCTKDLGPTFHNFGKLSENEQVKIDYIFANLPYENSYRVEDTPIDGQYYSDHNAVCTFVEIE